MSKSILIVEDEPLIALELQDALSAAGFQVVGPVIDVGGALQLLASPGCDAAVLDVNLGEETAAPVAASLRESGIPFAVVSGYSELQHPAAFAGAPYLAKPVDTAALVTVLRGLFT